MGKVILNWIEWIYDDIYIYMYTCPLPGYLSAGYLNVSKLDAAVIQKSLKDI